MKSVMMKSAMICLALFVGATICSAKTVTVGPTGQFATPCVALHSIVDGDTVLVDANNGVPYQEPADPTHGGRSDCRITANNWTIRGVNGRPILDATGELIQKAIFVLVGHDIVIDNLEFRNASDLINAGSSNNAAGLRIENGSVAAPNGGNVTVRRCYFHDSGDGILTNSAGPANVWFSPNPFLLFEFDEFARNGVNGDGHTHNMYIGYGGNLKFTLQYSWSHDAYLGHTVKSRAPINNILYNVIGDGLGDTSYLLNFPAGGSTYVVGNTLYKVATHPNSNPAMVLWRDIYDVPPTNPAYDPIHQDLHFTNNTLINDPANTFPGQFVTVECFNASSDTCPSPTDVGNAGPVLTVPGVYKNNLFIGPQTQITNQPNAVLQHNIVLPNTPATLKSIFANAARLDFRRLPSGSPLHK